ncbi:MAG: hypothetical protein ACAH80_13625 [Alphaproteobacteria bacterium]
MSDDTPPPPGSSDTYDVIVGQMRSYGAKNDREAHEAARNLIGFAQLALSVRRRQQRERQQQ